MMQNTRFGGLALLASLGLGLLTACGGDTPTATAIPTVAATRAAATVAPLAPTAMAPTATTGSMAATPTVAMSSDPATTPTLNPREGGPAATPPNGMGTTPTVDATGGMAATPTGGAMGGGMVATTADVALITQSFTTTANLKSFHYVIQTLGATLTNTTNLEGDYIAPDQLYGKGTQHGQVGEFLKVKTQNYKKDANGAWAPWVDPSETAPILAKDSMSKTFGGFATFAAASDFRDTGADETLDGVHTKHFVGIVALSKMAGMGDQLANMKNLPSAGTIALWIDPATQYVHKAELDLDMGPALAAAMAQLQTPVPGAAAPTPDPSGKISAHLTLSKLNDPSLTVPAAPAITDAPTAAPAAATATP